MELRKPDRSCLVQHKVMGSYPLFRQQVLNNLINNAIKFTEKGSINIVIKCAEIIDETVDETIELRVSVADTGIGIAQNEMDRLFRSFSQVDGSYTRKYGGTGLGLAISKQL
ncbi:MAG: hypothetical protein HZA13_09285, partial [Nitrospirae bacterium]|nr:hypothetical protein [Nitrospirota bacterium]